MTHHHPFLARLEALGLYTPPTTNGATTSTGQVPLAPVDTDQMSRYVYAVLVAECDAVRSTPEGGRNHRLNTAAFLVGTLLDGSTYPEGDATDALQRAGEDSGLPPREVATTIASGLRAGRLHPRAVQLRAGLAVPAAHTVDGGPEWSGTTGDQSGTSGDQGGGDADEDPEPAGDGLPPAVDWAAAWSGVAAEVDWLVPDVLERGRSHVLYAPAKVGKSLYVQTLCGELASQGIRVAYLDLENSMADIVERFQAMGYQPEDLADLRYFSFPSLAMLDTQAGGAQLWALVEHHQPELVVLDTTSRVVGGDENSSDTFRALYRYALVALKRAGITVLRIDHAGKDPTAGQRGSSAKGDDVDVVWLLQRHDDDHYTLRCDVQRSGHHPQTIGLVKQLDPLRFARVGETDDRPAVAALVAELDRLSVPLEETRRAAHQALAAAGIRARNGTLAEALRSRRNRSTSWESWSRTNHPHVDQVEINNSGPQDQLEFPVSADESGPGPSGDHGDQGVGAPVGPLVPDRWSLVGDHRGPLGPEPVPDRSLDRPWEDYSHDQLQHLPQDQLICDRCRYPAERLIPAPRGKRWCVRCAYPDPSTRPGAHHDEEENL